MNEKELKEFGLRLKQARDAKQMSMEELGMIIGSSKGSIWKYEHGLREPKASISIAIANTLGVLWSWLIGEDQRVESDDFLQMKDLYDNLSASVKEEALNYLLYLKERRKDGNSG